MFKIFSRKRPEDSKKASAEKTATIPSESQDVQQILMLEDEGELTAILKEYLESHAFRVTCVNNGVGGLKEIMAQDFDVIICDMLMPTFPGDKFFIAVQKTKPHLCSRFIFMTGHKGDRKIDDFIRSVQGIMLWKPFHPHELLETIQLILKRTR